MTPETIATGWLIFGVCVGFLGAFCMGFIRSDFAESREVRRLKQANAELRHMSTLVIEDNIGLANQVVDLEFAAVKPQLDELFGDTSPMVELEAELHWLSTPREDNVFRFPIQRDRRGGGQ